MGRGAPAEIVTVGHTNGGAAVVTAPPAILAFLGAAATPIPHRLLMNEMYGNNI